MADHSIYHSCCRTLYRPNQPNPTLKGHPTMAPIFVTPFEGDPRYGSFIALDELPDYVRDHGEAHIYPTPEDLFDPYAKWTVSDDLNDDPWGIAVAAYHAGAEAALTAATIVAEDVKADRINCNSNEMADLIDRLIFGPDDGALR